MGNVGRIMSHLTWAWPGRTPKCGLGLGQGGSSGREKCLFYTIENGELIE